MRYFMNRTMRTCAMKAYPQIAVTTLSDAKITMESAQYRRKILRLPSKKRGNDSNIFTTLFYEFLLVRRKILRLYFGLHRRKCGCFLLTDYRRPDT